MALVIVKEDGTGRVDANSYASWADGDAYFAGHAYPTPWVFQITQYAASPEPALVMATRLIDAYCRFDGFKKSVAQALQWPRQAVVDREADFGVAGVGLVRQAWPVGPVYLSADVVPACVVQATCEMARELLAVDRTGAPLGEGLKSSSVSGSTFVFDKNDRRPVLTSTVIALLSRVLKGSPTGASVPLRRA